MVRSNNMLQPPAHLVDKIDQRLAGAIAESLSRIYSRLWIQFGRTCQSDSPIARVIFAAVWAVESHQDFPVEKIAHLRRGG